MSQQLPTAENLFKLDGQVALVTGASRGIGEQIARTLAAYGAHVIVSSRKIDTCEAVAASIREAGGKADAIACHIGEMDQIGSRFEEIKSKHGELDILVNNAAAHPYFGDVLDADLGAFQKTVGGSRRGYVFMSVEAGKIMRKQKSGVILNIA